jgi:hypothetical protein
MDRISLSKEQYETFGFREFYGWPEWYCPPHYPLKIHEVTLEQPLLLTE